MLIKTTVNSLYNDIRCYLVIGSFNQKNVIFQQTVVRVHYILNLGITFITFDNNVT